MCFEMLGVGGGGWVDLDYNVSSLQNFLFSVFGFEESLTIKTNYYLDKDEKYA